MLIALNWLLYPALDLLADLNELHLWASLPSGFTLGFVKEEHEQEIKGRGESNFGLLIPLAPSHVSVLMSPQLLFSGFSHSAFL